MSKFEWQTEEDWEEIAIAESAPKSPRPRRWLWLASLVSLVVLAGYLIYQQVEQRVEEATNTVEQDVLSSLDVLEAANASGDVELVNGILSGRDPAWTDIQRDLIRASLLFDRSAFGLTLIGPPQVVSTTLSADLLAAQTTLHLDYAIAIGNGLTQTITLEQTAIFRQGARNWLFAPPEEEFWGDRAEISGSFISVQYPMRDEIISRRLANDLEQKIGELCARMAFDTVNCAGGVRVNLTLATHAGGLLMVKDPELWLQAGHELILPTPTLVGLPINEQAYQALYRGYAMVVLQAFIGERIGWQCCNRAALVGALLERQFAELALQSWPLLPQDYANLLNQGLLLADLVEIWDEAGFKEITPALYALADFLTNLTQTAVPATLIPIATGADTMNWMAAMMHS